MIKKFFTCGLLGWCLEILYTAACSLKNHDIRLKGNTSLWMFPIYGLAALFQPLSILLKGKPLFLRGCIYTICIFTTEYVTGAFLKKKHACPWNYEDAPLNIQGVIRLDYAPFWFGTGLLYEFLLNRSSKTTAQVP